MSTDLIREKYPAPDLPPEHTATFIKLSVCSYWAISGKAWIDCNDAPEYYESSIGKVQAKTYNEAKAHIEALAALGEL